MLNLLSCRYNRNQLEVEAGEQAPGGEGVMMEWKQKFF